MPGGPKRGKDDILIAQLAQGVSVEGAARIAGMGTTTAYRRLKDPEFLRRVEEARAELWKRAMSVLSKSAVEGAIVLRRLLRSDDAKIRLQAAKIVLEQGLKIRDQVDLAQRVAALEELAQQQKDSRR